MTVIAWFFTTKLGRILGAIVLSAAIVAGAYGAGWIKAKIEARSAAQIANLKSQLAAAKADADISAILHNVVQGQLADLQEQHSGLARQVSNYEQEVSKNGRRSFALAALLLTATLSGCAHPVKFRWRAACRRVRVFGAARAPAPPGTKTLAYCRAEPHRGRGSQRQARQEP
jgi:outer membrane murein-binding lipoprotein Lpp